MAKTKRDISRYKRKVTYGEKTMSRKELEKLVTKRVREVNQMLANIKRKHGKKELSWAGRKLRSKLSTKNLKAFNMSKAIISFDTSQATTTQLNAILKAINQFKESKTSTNKGIEKVREQHRDFLKEITNDPEFVDSLSDEYIDNAYRIYTDREIGDITDFIDPSELFALCIRAKQYGMSYQSFENMLLSRIDSTVDLDFRDSIIRIYELYVAR